MSDDEGTLLDKFFRRGETTPAASIFMLLGLLGGLQLAHFTQRAAAEPWHLDAGAPTVVAIGSQCGPFTGGQFVIEVEEQRYLCSGSDNKCGFEGAIEIAYDPTDPAACRAAKHVDTLSRYEQMLLLMAMAFACIGLSGLSYVLSERARHRDRRVARGRWRTATKLFMVFAALAINAAGLMIALAM